MKIKTGVDIVYLPRFRNAIKRGGEVFLKRVFLEAELVHLEGGIALHLAGIFAAKEAIMKALGLPTDSWHDIKITYSKSSAPHISFIRLHLNQGVTLTRNNYALSISHDGNYIIAQFVALIGDK